MRYLGLLIVVLLAGCQATQWSKPDMTAADDNRDFEECRNIAKPDPAIAAGFGAFGAVGVFVGVSYTDSTIRSCMEGKGWAKAGSQPAAIPSPAAYSRCRARHRRRTESRRTSSRARPRGTS